MLLWHDAAALINASSQILNNAIGAPSFSAGVSSGNSTSTGPRCAAKNRSVGFERRAQAQGVEHRGTKLMNDATFHFTVDASTSFARASRLAIAGWSANRCWIQKRSRFTAVRVLPSHRAKRAQCATFLLHRRSADACETSELSARAWAPSSRAARRGGDAAPVARLR